MRCTCCRKEYGRLSARCPYCGHTGNHIATPIARTAVHGHCAECDRGMHADPAECQWCGEQVHRACLKRHEDRCVRADMDAFIADRAELTDQTGGE